MHYEWKSCSVPSGGLATIEVKTPYRPSSKGFVRVDIWKVGVRTPYWYLSVIFINEKQSNLFSVDLETTYMQSGFYEIVKVVVVNENKATPTLDMPFNFREIPRAVLRVYADNQLAICPNIVLQALEALESNFLENQ